MEDPAADRPADDRQKESAAAEKSLRSPINLPAEAATDGRQRKSHAQASTRHRACSTRDMQLSGVPRAKRAVAASPSEDPLSPKHQLDVGAVLALRARQRAPT